MEPPAGGFSWPPWNLAALEDVADPRAGIARHDLDELLVIAFVSALGGSSSCTKMARSDAQKNVFSGTF